LPQAARDRTIMTASSSAMSFFIFLPPKLFVIYGITKRKSAKQHIPNPNILRGKTIENALFCKKNIAYSNLNVKRSRDSLNTMPKTGSFKCFFYAVCHHTFFQHRYSKKILCFLHAI